MKIAAILLMSLVILSSFAFGHTNLTVQVDAASKDVVGKGLPSPLGSLLKNQRLMMHILFEDNDEFIFSLVIDKGKIVREFKAGEVDDPTLHMYMDEATLAKIQSAENPASEMKKALQKGDITYKAVGFFNKIKFKFLTVFLNAFGEDEEEEEKEEVAAPEQPEEKNILTSSLPSKEKEKIAPPPAPPADEEEEDDETPNATTVAAPTARETTHTIKMTDSGFSEDKLTVKVGDTVTWENTRTGKLTGAMVIGSRFMCSKMKSQFFDPGETYSWMFDQPGTCVVVDGIYTTAVMNVIVEE